MRTLRLAVAHTPIHDGDTLAWEVQVFVDGTEMTSRAAGMGMDPFDVLVPTNRFEASVEPRTFGVARCGCGDFGCGVTTLTVVRRGDVVTWTWGGEVPAGGDVTFDAAAYDAEVARAGADRSWETPERTAGRLVLERVDRATLAAHGFRVAWVAGPEVCLWYGDTHQVAVGGELGGRHPEEAAVDLVRLLRDEPPRSWPARWHAVGADPRPPAVAGPDWSRWRFG